MESPSKMEQLKNTGKKAVNNLKNAAGNIGSNMVKLLKNSNNENFSNEISLIVDTKKIKIIKEKNIKNVITKYEISIASNVVVKLSETNTHKFSVLSNGDYSVSEQNSTTINNEKKLIKILSQDMADKIITELNLIINDL